MIISSKTLTLSGAWLIGRAKSMARDLLKRGPRYSSKQAVLEGYLIQAKRTGNIGSSNIIDLAAFLAVSGSYNIGGLLYFDLSYIQQLQRGRDSYLPGGIQDTQAPQVDPVIFGGFNETLSIGTQGAGRKLATRFWGVAQPFAGVGFAYGYGAIYGAEAKTTWALSNAREQDVFVYRINVVGPSFARISTGDDGGLVFAGGDPNAAQANWSLEISESVLAGSGAKAFVRQKEAPPPAGYEFYWDYQQYPWMTFAEPHYYADDEGGPAYEILVVGQVVFDEAGPYVNDYTASFTTWDPGLNGFTVASGAKGLWAGKIKVEKGRASIFSRYTYNGLDSSDEARQPQKIFREGETGPDEQPDCFWYQNNHHFKASPVRLDTGEYVMLVVSTVMKYDRDTQTNPSDMGTTFFVDVRWFYEDGGQHSQNIKTTKLSLELHDKDGIDISRVSASVYFDAGDDEMRWAIGSATDGEVMVAPVFSSFVPDESPMLHIVVADRDSASVSYSGQPGFAMLMCGLLDEAACVQYVDDPVIGNNDPKDDRPQKSWTIPAGSGQVSYIGNGKFAFYVSTEWKTPPETNTPTLFAASGNLAVAVYERGGGVTLAGVVDPDIPVFTMNIQGAGDLAMVQTMFSDRVGRIEVVRQESDDYQKGEKGNPATLIATRGWGAPSVNHSLQNGKDIKVGTTWISYDSGETWTLMLDYGSPAGVFHCGNTFSPRSEPIVRI